MWFIFSKLIIFIVFKNSLVISKRNSLLSLIRINKWTVKITRSTTWGFISQKFIADNKNM